MPASDRRYVVLAVFYADAPDAPEFLAVEGKIVVIDTLVMAQQLVPRLGGGRLSHWSQDRETICFTPLVRKGYNRIAIWRNYDPYDVPSGFRAKGVWSETESLDWRYHVHWCHVIKEILAWADSVAATAYPDTVEPVLI